jgi:hypothetical protein
MQFFFIWLKQISRSDCASTNHWSKSIFFFKKKIGMVAYQRWEKVAETCNKQRQKCFRGKMQFSTFAQSFQKKLSLSPSYFFPNKMHFLSHFSLSLMKIKIFFSWKKYLVLIPVVNSWNNGRMIKHTSIPWRT